MSNFFNVIGARLANARSRRMPDSRSKIFHCVCGQPIFFGNTHCIACNASLGFDADSGELLALEAVGPTALAAKSDTGVPASMLTGESGAGGDERWRIAERSDRRLYRRCANLATAAMCNWLVPDEQPGRFCLACRLNRTIPDLTLADNPARWHKLEAAKRHLIAQLLTLGLPVQGKTPGNDGGLAFDLVGPDADGVLPMTGHDDGLITINVLEADDDYRARLREAMHEPYRTLLGHFRHEIGHYYWDILIRDTAWLIPFRDVFGDERLDYAQALRNNYENGPPEGWDSLFISTYAACHPWEDWAETWAHYLHMMDTLDTALSLGITTDVVEPAYALFTRSVLVAPDAPDAQEFLDMVNTWVALTGVLNELSRSMGQRDFYPFVLPHKVVGKLQFVHRVVKQKSLALEGARQQQGA